MKRNRAQRTTNLSLALKGFWAKIDMKLHERFMSFVGHERCPLLQELNNQPSRLLLTLKGVVNEQLLPSRMGSVIRTWPLLRTKSGLTTSEQAGCDLFDQGRRQDRHSTGRTAQSELNQRVGTRTPQKMGSASANATPRKPLEESSTEDAGVRSSPATRLNRKSHRRTGADSRIVLWNGMNLASLTAVHRIRHMMREQRPRPVVSQNEFA